MKAGELSKELLDTSYSIPMLWPELNGTLQDHQKILVRIPLASRIMPVLVRHPPQRGRDGLAEQVTVARDVGLAERNNTHSRLAPCDGLCLCSSEEWGQMPVELEHTMENSDVCLLEQR